MKIQVEDRNSGETLATGGRGNDGRITFDHHHLSDARREELAAIIGDDINKGHSGGQLHRGLEWFELMTRQG